MPTNPDLISELQNRVSAELGATFDASKPVITSYAPARLDVMGSITDYCGSDFISIPITKGCAVALQRRTDRQFTVFSFNLFDQHRPFTLAASLAAFANPLEQLRRDFAEPGRTWAGYVAGCLAVLHAEKHIDLLTIEHGFNLAVLSDVPWSQGLGSSRALVASAMDAISKALGLMPEGFSDMCQKVENQIIGLPSGPMDFKRPASSASSGRWVGITTGQPAPTDIANFTRFRCAAFIAHKLILEKMRQLGRAAARELIADPMGGKLAHLSLDDYRKYFRSFLPESLKGGAFMLEHGKTIDDLTKIEPDHMYEVQKAADFHVFQANRIKNYLKFIREGTPAALNKAGHLMYAAQISYRKEAGIADANCDKLVELIERNESNGIYGGKISGRGGSIVTLCETTQRADDAIADIMSVYESETGLKPTRVDACL